MLLLVTFLAALSAPAWADSGAVPPEVLQHVKDWPLPNKDYSSTRATMDSEINSGNVKNLQVVWSMPINATGAFGTASSNPLILGDTIYFQDLKSNIYSVDLATGKVNWMRNYNQSTVGPNGPAVGWGKVFAAKGVYDIAALDMKTGKELWGHKHFHWTISRHRYPAYRL
jgi:glucose dehydrogenase